MAASIARASLLALLPLICGTLVPVPAVLASQPGQGQEQPVGEAASTRGDQLPVKSITLYRSGVASIQRRGLVEGDRTIQLKFDTGQINDILKSMVVLDLSGNGRVGGVSYASRDPLAKRLSSFGVNIADDPTLWTILGRLRGARIAVSMPDGEFTGTVIGGETRQRTFGESPTTVMVPFVNLLTDKGIKSVDLTVASNVQILDKELAAELTRALAAVAEHRADHIKTVDVGFFGTGSREVVVGYVQEAPVWKASYRLVLPKADAKPQGDDATSAQRLKERLSMQGWAIIENTTDEDWNQVDLSLVSGQPVSFRMDLYQPLYASRPMVPVPTVPGVAPRIFEGGVPTLPPASAAPPIAGTPGAPSKRGRGESEKYQDAAGKPGAGGFGASPFRDSGEEMANYAAQSQATAAESGEIFEYRLNHPVTIERQRSAMLPIISSDLSGRRVSIFSIFDGSSYPMRGLELLNDSGLELLPGPIAVYDDGTYAGDAQIGHVPAGDKRLLAYSVDLEVDALYASDQTSNVLRLRIVSGLLEMTSLTRSTATYTFANKDTKRSRTVIVEHGKDSSWELKQPSKAYETTDSLYRFAMDVESGKTSALKVVQERVDLQQLEVVATGLEALLSYRTSGAKVSDKVVEAVRKAGELAAAVRQVEQRSAQLTKEKAEIDADQGRIRQNMTSIDRASPLYAKYLQKLTEQEGRVDAIGEEVRKAAADQVAAQNALNTYLANLDVE